MDKRKSILNVASSVVLKIIAMVLVLVSKRFLIQFCGNDVNGLNALYLSIIGFFAVAELGVGSAISFCMYKPIVEGDTGKVSALYHLFRRLYLGIGLIILVAGLCITPFLPFFAKDYAQLDVNLYSTFILMLISVALTYTFGAKTALINAYKNNYITSVISLGGLILQYIMQIAVLLITRSFVWYLVCRVVIAIIQWLVTELIVRRKYLEIVSHKQKIDSPTKAEVTKNIKAMFLHKVGFVLVNTVDSIIISMVIGVAVLGKYSNYTMILTSITSILNLIFTSLTSVVGHLYVEESKEKAMRYSEVFHLLNFALGAVFFLGYYAVADDLVAMFFAKDLIISRSIVAVVTLNGFIQFMRQSTLLFRDATGTFYHDRWKPLAEGVANLILSLILVKFMGIVGVVAATIATNIFICHVVEPHVLYKNAFSASPKKYYFKNYSMIALFAGSMFVLDMFKTQNSDPWKAFFANGFISVGVSVAACAVALIISNKTVGLLLTLMKNKKQTRDTK